MERLWNLMWLRERRVQKQLMSLVQMESLWKAAATLQTGAAIDGATLAGAGAHLGAVVREKSRMGSQKEDNFSKCTGILPTVPAIVEGPLAHALPRQLERLKTRRTITRPVP